ncbi:MAG: hypothetical protein AABY98_00860 [Candidatus Deferrimicrobiota bacterium]
MNAASDPYVPTSTRSVLSKIAVFAAAFPSHPVVPAYGGVEVVVSRKVAFAFRFSVFAK